MRALFVSDCHLSAQHPDTLALFKRFLQNEARDADALYILGDLFEYWLGDDDDTPAYEDIRVELKTLAAHTQVFVMRGNRDIMLGERFARRIAGRLLPDEYKTALGGQEVLLMHGDLLCADDTSHLRFRRVMQHPATQRLLRAAPLSSRRRFAEYLRKKSRASMKTKPPEIMDVNADAVARTMRKHNVSLLIHGHTHRPAEHSVDLGGGRTGRRIVLDAWHPYGAAGAIAVGDDGIRHLRF